MQDVRLGTSGFDYLDWLGPFYPEKLPRKDFLAFYASVFSTLELNFSYYRMPTAAQMGSLASRVPGEFDFSVKAHESLTHRVDANWEESAVSFREAMEPLVCKGQLAAVLLQFPFGFHYEPDNRRYLKKLLESLHGLPLVVEFRNIRWMTPRVFRELEKMKVSLCAVDAPELEGLPVALDRVTGNLSYVRFHGRNQNAWWGSDAVARYDYLYGDAELEAWVPRLQTLSSATNRQRVYFNNHRRGQAPANAIRLQEILGKSAEAIPPGKPEGPAGRRSGISRIR